MTLRQLYTRDDSRWLSRSIRPAMIAMVFTGLIVLLMALLLSGAYDLFEPAKVEQFSSATLATIMLPMMLGSGAYQVAQRAPFIRGSDARELGLSAVVLAVSFGAALLVF